MNPSTPRPRETISARCPHCGRSFDCGRNATTLACWCKSMPPLPADRLEPGSRCLCPECLADKIARTQREAAPRD
jgi:hypothetical protein